MRRNGDLRPHSDLHDRAELYEFLGALEPSVAQAPSPLQLFLPACLASPPPWPLQAFFPLQECMVGSGCGLCEQETCSGGRGAVDRGLRIDAKCSATEEAGDCGGQNKRFCGVRHRENLSIR
jgi:hypothetical protein